MVMLYKSGKVLSSTGQVQEAVTPRIRCGLKKIKDIESVLCKKKKTISMQQRGSIYKRCARSVFIMLWCQVLSFKLR